MSSKAPVGIIGAMDIEINVILKEMSDKKKVTISGIDFYSGDFGGVSCVVSKCNAGKVNAAICAQTIALKYSPKAIINIGVAGGVGKDIHIGDMVIGTACIQHDYDTTDIDKDYQKGYIWGINKREIPCDDRLSKLIYDKAREIYSENNVHLGIIITGDQFISSAEKSLELSRDFSALACEMEGGSIAHVCYANGIPVAVLRGISDNANESGSVDFLEFASESAVKTQKLLKSVLKEI